MFNVPSIHLPNVSHNPYLPSRNMDIRDMIKTHLDRLAEGRPRRYYNRDFETDDDYSDHNVDVRGRRDYDYREEDRHVRREAESFTTEQDDLEIAHMEKAVLEARRALDDAKRNLMDTQLRIRDRRRGEMRQLRERDRVSHSVPEFTRPRMDDVYERASQPVRDYLSPAKSGSRAPTPKLSLSSSPTRSRSPSPYRFSKSEIIQSSQSDQSPPHSRTPSPAVREEEGGDATQEQVYQSFGKLHDLAREFRLLKRNFVYPSVLEFEKPGSRVGEIITVRTRSSPDELVSDGTDSSEGSKGKLVYTRANEAFHAYTDAMEKLLGKLDSVDSWNETSVRNRRRKIIGEIEQEASRLERYRQKVWRDYVAQ